MSTTSEQSKSPKKKPNYKDFFEKRALEKGITVAQLMEDTWKKLPPIVPVSVVMKRQEKLLKRLRQSTKKKSIHVEYCAKMTSEKGLTSWKLIAQKKASLSTAEQSSDTIVRGMSMEEWQQLKNLRELD